MDILRQLKRQAEQVEVVNILKESTTVEFEANKLKTSQVEETKGTAVRVVRNGRLGFAASSDEKSLDKLMVNALESASYGDQVPIVFPSKSVGPEVNTFDQSITSLSITRLVEIGQELIAEILEEDSEVQINVQITRGVSQLEIRNQTGHQVSLKRSPLSISVEVNRIEGDDVLIIWEINGTTLWEDDYLSLANRMVEKLVLSRKLTSIHSGKYPVIFSPAGSLVLGLPLMEGLNGKSVFTGISPVGDKAGEKLFDKKLTLIDDGTVSGKFGSASYDDEGVAHHRNPLIEKGILNGFLYDLKTAAQAGVASTGNGARDLFSPPRPSPTNLIIQGGEVALKEMIAGIDQGLLVEDVLGLGQGNIISGAFSNPLSLAFKIEKGEIVGRVKNASIAGNVYDLLKDISAISHETQWIYNNFNLPYIMLPEMNVVADQT